MTVRERVGKKIEGVVNKIGDRIRRPRTSDLLNGKKDNKQFPPTNILLSEETTIGVKALLSSSPHSKLKCNTRLLFPV